MDMCKDSRIDFENSLLQKLFYISWSLCFLLTNIFGFFVYFWQYHEMFFKKLPFILFFGNINTLWISFSVMRIVGHKVTKNLHAGKDKRNKITVGLKNSKLLPGGWAAGQKESRKGAKDLRTYLKREEKVSSPWTWFCILLWWSVKNIYAASGKWCESRVLPHPDKHYLKKQGQRYEM